jgi:hypothetical protein
MYQEQQSNHWKEALSSVICLIGGLVIIIDNLEGSGSGEAVLAGLGLILAAVLAFIITEGWQHVDDLPIVKKIIAYIPVIVCGVAVYAVTIVVTTAWVAVKDALEGK